MNKGIYEGIRSTLKLLSQKSKRVSKSAVVGIIAAIVITTFAIYINIENHMVYIVKVNNKKVGYIKNLTPYNQTLKAIKSTDGEECLSKISFQKVRNDSASFTNEEGIEKFARAELGLKIQGYIMSLNGEELAKVAFKEDTDKILNHVKQYYIDNTVSSNDNVKVLSTDIKEKVDIKEEMIYPKDLTNIDDLVKKLVAGKGTTKTYVVKKGDTIWDIAASNNLRIEDIQANNPSVDTTKIKPDQKLKLAVSTPYLNVQIVADVTGKEKISYQSENVKDSSIYSGDKKVKQKGEYGVANVEKKVTMVNGEVISEEVLKNEVVTAPKNEIVAVGTKQKSYYTASSVNVTSASSTGTFMYPARGMLSSYFGYRSGGEFHTGLDIAAPIGTPISAADSGTVSFVGWTGGYGRCVIITHANGYQTLYGHTSATFVNAGDVVSKGQHIANVGVTGRTTGPHVHFEVRLNGVQVNPLNYLR